MGRGLFRIILACGWLSYGCSTIESGPVPDDGVITAVSVSPIPLRLPRVEVSSSGEAAKKYVMHGPDLDQRLRLQNPSLTTLQAGDFHRWSQWSFWGGLAGAVLSLVADGQDYVAGRTTGNALWGLGWVGWLGFYGLAQAEYNDAVAPTMNLGRRNGLGDTEQDSGGRNFERPHRAWSLRWRLAAF